MKIFVSRDHLGVTITGLYASAQTPGQEQIDDSDPAVQAFQAAGKTPDSTPLLKRITNLEANVQEVMAVPVIAIALPAQPVLDQPALPVQPAQLAT